jgi:hypothetical protein
MAAKVTATRLTLIARISVADPEMKLHARWQARSQASTLQRLAASSVATRQDVGKKKPSWTPLHRILDEY